MVIPHYDKFLLWSLWPSNISSTLIYFKIWSLSLFTNNPGPTEECTDKTSDTNQNPTSNPTLPTNYSSLYQALNQTSKQIAVVTSSSSADLVAAASSSISFPLSVTPFAATVAPASATSSSLSPIAASASASQRQIKPLPRHPFQPQSPSPLLNQSAPSLPRQTANQMASTTSASSSRFLPMSSSSQLSVISPYATTYLQNGSLVTRIHGKHHNQVNHNQHINYDHATVAVATNPSQMCGAAPQSHSLRATSALTSFAETSRQPYQILQQRSLPASPHHG